MDITDVQNLGPVIQSLNDMAAEFAAQGTGYQILSLTLIKDAKGGSITFTLNPATKTYDVTIQQ